MRPALFIGVIAAALAACNSPQWDWDRMIHQTKLEPMQQAPFFADGRAMRPPVDGTISREADLDEGRATGLVDKQYLDSIPIKIDRAAIEHGRNRFDVYCAACHGELGDGDSSVARNMDLRKPPSLLSAEIAAFPIGRVFEIESRGYGLMPSYANALSIEERWQVAAYVRALQLRAGTPLDSLPPDARDQARKELAP